MTTLNLCSAASLLLALAAAPGVAAAADNGPFRFPLPAGFVDLSPGAPPASIDVMDDIKAEAKSGKYAAYAVAQEGFGVYYAMVRDGAEDFDEARADAVVGALGGMVAGGARVADKKAFALGGQHGGRLVIEQGPLKALVYLLPWQGKTAVLVYWTRARAFDQMLPRFEASATGTRGALASGLVFGVGLKNVALIAAGLSGLLFFVWLVGRRARGRAA